MRSKICTAVNSSALADVSLSEFYCNAPWNKELCAECRYDCDIDFEGKTVENFGGKTSTSIRKE